MEKNSLISIFGSVKFDEVSLKCSYITPVPGGVGPIGCGLLCIQGTSFSFISPIIGAGLNGGLAAIFGAVISGSVVEMFVSRVLRYTRKIITPLVSGVVVTLIGLSLIKVGVIACGGGFAAKENGTFGSFGSVFDATLLPAFDLRFGDRIVW